MAIHYIKKKLILLMVIHIKLINIFCIINVSQKVFKTHD